jgi:uncharacterized protein
MKIRNDIKITESLNGKGYATLKNALSPQQCIMLQHLYDDPECFRSIINMQRYRFGKGEYKYFNYPLPPLLQQLRTDFYSMLFPVANDWMQRLSLDVTFPDTHEKFLAACHSVGQTRPTPLILKYEAGGFNTLHQDLYGEIYFPFQVVFVLSNTHQGGELVFVEQVPRAQSKAEVVNAGQGDAVIFTTNFRPVNGTRGYYKARMKHGVSEVKSGIRMALGLIFHDAFNFEPSTLGRASQIEIRKIRVELVGCTREI